MQFTCIIQDKAHQIVQFMTHYVHQNVQSEGKSCQSR
jgi:hypothetical protein